MAWVSRESRRKQRENYDAIQHFDAIDSDLDTMEASASSYKKEQAEQWDVFKEEITGAVRRTNAILIGLLVSTAAAAIGAALNLLFKF